MESLQKFECWEELSDEESATISGGTGGFGTTIIGPLGQTSAGISDGGVSLASGGVGGQTAVSIGKDGVSIQGTGIANSFTITLG